MNLKKFFLLSSMLTSFMLSNTAHVHIKQNVPLTKLWNGVLTSNVRLVQQALAEGADPSVQFGRYGDTALMTAIRIYCHTLMTQNNVQKKFLKTILASSATLFIYLMLQRFMKNKDSFLIPLATYGTFIAANSISIKITPSSAKIVEMLINAEANTNIRNKEGITALDVLNAYFPFAYQAQDENWYKFLHLLLKKGSST